MMPDSKHGLGSKKEQVMVYKTVTEVSGRPPGGWQQDSCPSVLADGTN